MFNNLTVKKEVLNNHDCSKGVVISILREVSLEEAKEIKKRMHEVEIINIRASNSGKNVDCPYTTKSILVK